MLDARPDSHPLTFNDLTLALNLQRPMTGLAAVKSI